MSKPIENDTPADLQIGPTDMGMVRFIILQNGRAINMDFEPDEALEIAEEIRIAAAQAEKLAK